ncbi:hypothetical protein [[Clostridium] fimetarium]|uniref:Ig-like domain (Group 2) n=1 Tax=[Clostridium] fimetarium TaxID=99656 RepID=A0A1I0QWE1_9FIRM|nr:hypothetical protein [[Clostridium] fimetarium]SEW31757.1 hypothetical protein SAMN05421659_109179 [[Clostridium] fimetarium]
MKQLVRPQKKISIISCLFLICILFVGCGSKTTEETSTSTQKVQVSKNIENPTVGTQQITVTTSDGKTVTFDENEVETSVDSNGNTTYKLDDNTTVVVSSTEGTATVTTKNEDGTTSSTVSNNVTVTPETKEVEVVVEPITQVPAQPVINVPVDIITNIPAETQQVTQAPTNAPPVETQSPTEAPTNPPETEPYVEPTEAPTQPYIPPAPWTLDVADYQAKIEAKLRAAGKVTIKEYCISEYGTDYTLTDGPSAGAGYDEAYVSKNTYQWNLDVAAVGVQNAYYIEYRGIDNNGFYVFRFYRI